VTRRTFSAAAAGAAALSAAGGRIRVAMIGTGHGHAFSKIKALRSMPEYDLAGVHRPDSRDEPKDGDPLRGVRWLSLDEIIGDSSVELVAIESADVDQNLVFAEKCVRAGKFVHFDKPPGADLERLRRLLADAAGRKRVVQMGYQWRYHPAMQMAIEAARKGWLGQVYRFRASIDKLILPDERRHLAKFRGGTMFSEGCHLIDRAVDLLGKPKRAAGFLRHDSTLPDTLADNNVALLEYDGALAEISMASFHPHGARYRFLEILGTNGSARMQPYTFPSQLSVDLGEARGPYKAGGQKIEVPAPSGLTYTHDFAEMAGVIRRGEKPNWSPEHDLMTHETLLRICGMLGS
jgi:predicted dehydrogenase